MELARLRLLLSRSGRGGKNELKPGPISAPVIQNRPSNALCYKMTIVDDFHNFHQQTSGNNGPQEYISNIYEPWIV